MAYLYKSPTQPDGSGGNDNVPSITGDSDFDKYLSTLPQEQKQKELDAYNAPPSGEELNSIMAQKNANGELFHMSGEQFQTWKEFRKGQEVDVLHGLAEGADSILHDFGNAIGTMASHPLTSTIKAVPSFVEAFTQGTRNLYGMLAQSEDPNSVLFKFKDVIAGNGSNLNAEYSQFMDAQRFRLNSQDLASGKSTLLLNKDYIDHDMTQAMSYIADPTLFIPFGEFASAGMKAVGMGATLAKVGAVTSHLKGLAYGGALKLAGVPLEFIGGATRNVIDKTIAGGGMAAEAITGVSAKDIAQTVKVTALGTTGAAIAGHGGIVAGVGSVYLGAGGAAGLGEALSAMGTQAMKNKGARGMLTLAESALAESAAIVEKGGSGLSQHAQNLLKIINAADPMFAYANAAVTGVAHGAVIGGTLGYLNAGKEGMAHGIGAGMALGGVGALGGKLFADLSGGTSAAHAKIQREMVQALLKESDPAQYAHNEMILKHAELNGWNADRYIAAMDKVASGVKTEARDTKGIADLIRAHGEDPETYKGFKTKDGQPVLDADGNKVRLVDADGFRIPTVGEFDSANGFVLTKGGKDGSDFKVHLNLASMSKYTLPHELFHTVFKKMVIEPDFQKRLNNAILGEYDANGNMVTAPKISKEDARQFYRTYIEHLYSDKSTPEAERITKLQRDFRHERLDEALDEYYKTGKMTVESPDHKGTPLLHAMGEEFGAHYFAHFIEGKPLDYLFRGGQLGGIRGIIENAKDAWASHWEGQAKRVNPSLNLEGMDADIHGGFVNRDGKRIRVQALDYLMRDLIRARSQIKGKGFDIRTMSPEAQKTYVTSNGLNRRYKKDENTGNYRPRTEKEQKEHDKQSGIEAKKILSSLPAGDRTSVSDPKTGDITGVLSDKEVDALVSNGLLDHAEGVTIKTIQNIASNPNGGNVGTLMYHGYSQQTAVGYDARVFRPNTTARARKVLIHGYESRIDDKGNFSFRAKTLDLEAMELNQDRQWSNPEVRKHWKDDKTAFIADFYKYLENASKPATDPTRRPSAEILGENGAEKRNVLHQVAAFASSDSKQFKNTPTAKIPRDIRQSFMDLRSDAMSDLRIENGNKIVYDHQNAHEDIQTNFSPRRMKVTDTPEGEIFEHESGYKFLRTKSGETKAYDVTDKNLGTFKTLKEAVDTIKVQYAKEFNAEKPVVSLDNAAAEASRDLAPKEPIVLKTKEEFRQKLLEDTIGLTDTSGLHQLITELSYHIRENSKWKGQEIKNAKLQSLIDRAEARIEYLERNAGEVLTPFSDSLEKDLVKDYYDEYMDSNRKSEFAKIADNLHQQQAPKEYRSGLVDQVNNLLWNKDGSPNTDMTAALLLKMIRKGGSKGQRLWTEAMSIGLIDYLQAEAKKTVDVVKPYRKINPETGTFFPRGAGEGTYGTQRVGVKTAPLDMYALNQFIDANRIKLTIETNPREVRNLDTEHFTMDGTTSGYESTAVRINPQFRSGVTGHYGEAVVHTRSTFRVDSEGNNHTFTEEVQANNAEGDASSRITQEQYDHANGIILARERNAIAIDKLYFLESLANRQRNDILIQPSEISNLLRDISRTKSKAEIEAKIRDLKISPVGEKLQTLARLYNGTLVDYVKYLKTHYTPEKIEIFENEIKKHLSRNDSIGENRPHKTKAELEKRYQRHIHSLFNIESDYTGGFNTNHNFTLESLLDGSYYKELLKGKVKESDPLDILTKLDALGRHFDDFSAHRHDFVPENALVPENQLAVLLRNVIEHTSPDIADNNHGKLGYVANLHEGDGLGSTLHNEKELSYIEGDYDYFRQNVTDRIKKEPFYEKANIAKRQYESQLEAVKKLIPREVFVHKDSALDANLLDGMNSHDDFLTEHQFEALVTDAKTLVDKFKLQGKETTVPMQNVNDWGIIGLKAELRKAALRGSDFLTLTHPDDSPSISHMAEAKRRALYGEILPNLWDGFLKKYGIKGERVKGKLAVEVAEAHAELAKANAKTSEAVKVAMDEFQRTNGAGEDMSSLYRLSQLISEPIHNVEIDTHGVFASQWYYEGRDILNNLTTGELRNRLSDAFDAKVAEAKMSENLKEIRKNTGTYSADPSASANLVSAEVLDRGVSWKLTQEVKDAFLRDDADSELTNYSPKKVGESNGRYDHDSKEWKSGFIGKYAGANQEKIKDMSVQFFRRADGSYRLTLADNSGNTINVGHITADVNHSIGNRVMEISSNIAPEYRGDGLSYVLYSEMAERLRDMGVQAITGTIVNKDGIPVRVREKIIGDTRRLADDMPISQERAKAIINSPNNGQHSVKVYNILEGDAHYSPKNVNEGKQGGDGFIPNIKGFTKLKAGFSRVYHQTTADNIESIKRSGLLVSKSRPSSESRGVSVSETPFYGNNPDLVTIELQVPTEKLKQANGSSLLGDVPAENIIAVHEPWHEFVRYIENNPASLKEVLNGDMDFFIGDGSPEAKAIEYIKNKHNKNSYNLSVTEGEQGGRTYSTEQMSDKFIGRFASKSPNITKGMRVEFEKTRSSKFGDEYILRLFKKDKANGSKEIMIGKFNSEINGNSASSGNAEIKGDFRNKGYGRLMYSEMAERLRALGAESWDGRMIDQARRPQTLRERVIDQENARLGYQDSETKLSDERQDYNGDKTFYIESTLHKDAWYSPSKKGYTPSEEGKAKLLEVIKANPNGVWAKAFASGQATIDESAKYIGKGFRWQVHGADTAKAEDGKNGGIGFPLLHKGHGWAGESGAFIKDINAIMEWNLKKKGERVAPMLVKMAHPEKMRGASQGTDSGISRLASLTKPESGSPVTENQLLTAIRRAYEHTETRKDVDGNVIIDAKTGKPKQFLIQDKKINGLTLDAILGNLKEHLYGEGKNSQKQNRALIEGTIRELHNQIGTLSETQISDIKKVIPSFEGNNLSINEDKAGATKGGFHRALFGNDVEPMTQLGSFSDIGEGSGYAVVLFREPLVDSKKLGKQSPHPSYKISGATESGSPVQVDLLSNPQFLGDIFTHQVKVGENIKKLPTDATISNVAERNIPMATVYSPKKMRESGQALIRAIEAQADKDKVPKAITDGVRRLVNATKRQYREDLKEIPQEVKDGVQALKDAIDAHSDNEGIPPKIKAGVAQLVKEAEFGDLQPQGSLPKPTATASQLQSGLEALVGKKLKISPPKQAEQEQPPSVSQVNNQGAEEKNPVVLSNSLPPPANTPPPSPQPAPVPSTPAPTSQVSKPPAYTTWTMEKTGNNTIYKNSINYLIMVQADKFKVYNPQRELVGIYGSIEQAKRRVQREEPKR